MNLQGLIQLILIQTDKFKQKKLCWKIAQSKILKINRSKTIIKKKMNKNKK